MRRGGSPRTEAEAEVRGDVRLEGNLEGSRSGNVGELRLVGGRPKPCTHSQYCSILQGESAIRPSYLAPATSDPTVLFSPKPIIPPYND